MDAIFLTACVGEYKTVIYRPLGSYQIAWYLRKHGYQAQVIDFIHLFSEEELIKMIGTYITKETKVLGLGMMINPREDLAILKKIENVLRRIKERCPWVKLIVGSAIAKWWSRTQRNRKLFDYIFIGHTEDQVLELMNHLCLNGKSPSFEIEDGNRIIRASTPTTVEKKFDIQTCDHLWHDRDYIQPGETLPIELGRGCIFKCKFCQYPHIGKHKKDFNRDMECVRNEFLHNYEKWGVTNYYMLDDTFNADQERLKQFHSMTQTLPFKINYSTYLRLDLIAAHPGSEILLQESGLRGAYLGIETFNQDSADLIGKGWMPKHAKQHLVRLYHDVWKEKVSMTIGLICGLPPETFEECKSTNQWMIDNRMPDWRWHGLDINKESYSEYRSEFDKDSEKYGFVWEMREGRYIWKTEFCDALLASEWANELNNLSKPYKKFGIWRLMSLATLGESIDEFQKQILVNADWQKLADKQKSFLSNYYQQVISKKF